MNTNLTHLQKWRGKHVLSCFRARYHQPLFHFQKLKERIVIKSKIIKVFDLQRCFLTILFACLCKIPENFLVEYRSNCLQFLDMIVSL